MLRKRQPQAGSAGYVDDDGASNTERGRARPAGRPAAGPVLILDRIVEQLASDGHVRILIADSMGNLRLSTATQVRSDPQRAAGSRYSTSCC
jgi:hypothetical protein